MEYRKNYKKTGVLSRKIIASGLSAVFSAGVFSGYVEATELATEKELLIIGNTEKVIPKLEHYIDDSFEEFCEGMVNDLKEISSRLYNSECFPSILEKLEMEEKEFIKTFNLEKNAYKEAILKNRGALLDYYVFFVLLDKCKHKNEDGEELEKCNYDNMESFLTLENFEKEIVADKAGGFGFGFSAMFNGFYTFRNLFKKYSGGKSENEDKGEKGHLPQGTDNLTEFEDAEKQISTDPESKIKGSKINWKYIIIISIIAIIVVTIIVILILALGSKGKEADQNTQNGNNNNNEGENANTPGKNKNGNGTKQNDGGGLGILGNSLATGAGIAGGIGTKFAADKILGHGEQGGNNGNSENGKNSQKGQKNRYSNGPYTYIDSEGKVMTKAEGK